MSSSYLNMESIQSIQDHDPRKIRIKFLLRFGSIKARKTMNKRTEKKQRKNHTKRVREKETQKKKRKKPKQGEGRLEKKQTKTEGKKRALPN